MVLTTYLVIVMNHYCEIKEQDCVHCYQSDLVNEVFCGVTGIPVRYMDKCGLEMSAKEKIALRKENFVVMNDLRLKYRSEYEKIYH